MTEEKLSIPSNMILRDDKTNLLQISFSFSEQRIMQLTLSDKGFGEFYESRIATTGKEIKI